MQLFNLDSLGIPSKTEFAPVILLDYTVYKEKICWSKVSAILCATIPPRAQGVN